MAEILSQTQIRDLVGMAKEAIKSRRLSFFSQQGLRANFPWLTSGLAKRQLDNDRKRNINTGVFCAALAIGWANTILMFSKPEPNDYYLLTAAATGVGIIALARSVLVSNPIDNAYYSSVGGYRQYQRSREQQDADRRKSEEARLKILIS